MSKRKGKIKEHKDTLFSFVEGLFTFVNLTLLTLAYSFVWFSGKLSTPFPFGGNVPAIGVYTILLYTFTSLYGGYKIGQLKRLDVINSQLISVLFVNAITYLQISLMERGLVFYKFIPIILLTIADFIIIACWAYIADKAYKRIFPPSNVVLIYDDNAQWELVDIMGKLNSRKDKFVIKYAISAPGEY